WSVHPHLYAPSVPQVLHERRRPADSFLEHARPRSLPGRDALFRRRRRRLPQAGGAITMSYVASFNGLFTRRAPGAPVVERIEIPIIQRDYAQGRDSDAVAR